MVNQIERGVGQKVLLVHGLGGSWQSWSTILDALSAKRTVIAIDLPGHGATPAEHDSGTFEGLVGSVERYISDNGLAGIDVVGSSMGGRIVLELARRGSVGNVVALDPGGFWRGWERTFFKITIGASGRLLRAQVLIPLGYAGASNLSDWAKLSRPWPHLVLSTHRRDTSNQLRRRRRCFRSPCHDVKSGVGKVQMHGADALVDHFDDQFLSIGAD